LTPSTEEKPGMHPLEKIIVLMTVCQVLHASYTVRRLHREHASWRYGAEIIPLLAATAALVVLVLRIFNLVPYVGI
jgi:hypothetical protein